MASKSPHGLTRTTLRRFLDNEASGGLVLMFVAAMALAVANSPLSSAYFATLKFYIGPLNVQHWISDALMAVFFLLVGLEIKREMLDGQLSTWSRRLLPGAAAAGGMLVPASVYAYLNWGNPEALRGWAIPMATDIAFALGVLSLFGSRVPASLKVFLAALAIIDDLGAVLVIAVFYTADLNLIALLGAGAIVVGLVALNRFGVKALGPYLLAGVVLWTLVLASGVHSTLAGVVLALSIPLKRTPSKPEASAQESPLHKLEHLLHKPVAFLVVPVFGFANAGVSFTGLTPSIITEPITMGVAAGLLVGKLIGVFGTVFLLVKAGVASLPASASWGQMLGVSLLCGIGFTMSLFIGQLAFSDPAVQDQVKIGILAGSAACGTIGAGVIALSGRRSTASAQQRV